jgi:hypothetical protein
MPLTVEESDEMLLAIAESAEARVPCSVVIAADTPLTVEESDEMEEANDPSFVTRTLFS